ncbi:hypothetical protein [Marinomonas atlantica]|uniref:hypothetical protein n=1 Tax=Marinomonas atlantica TaxID=1806668 RepID=UPI00082B4E88|nr:hypothetical protein [Marinomonas atlantica]
MEIFKEIWQYTKELFKGNKSFLLICAMSAVVLSIYFFSAPYDFVNEYGILQNLHVVWMQLVLILALGFLGTALVLIGASSLSELLKQKIKTIMSKRREGKKLDSLKKTMTEEFELRWESLTTNRRRWLRKVANDGGSTTISNRCYYSGDDLVPTLIRWGYLVTGIELANGKFSACLIPEFCNWIIENTEDETN